MRCTRTIVTVIGLALAGVSALVDAGEAPADATASDPRPASPAPASAPASTLGAVAGR